MRAYAMSLEQTLTIDLFVHAAVFCCMFLLRHLFVPSKPKSVEDTEKFGEQCRATGATAGVGALQVLLA